jgi:magnesium-transporting ATPase (P-type)
MVRPLQVLQIYFLHCLASVGVPANLYYFLLQLKLSLLPFLDNWFSPYLPVKSLYYDTPPKLGDVFVDYVFLRNLGQIFLLMVVLACFWFVFLILGNKRVVSHKVWHSFLSEVSQKRYGVMVYNDVLSLFYLPILYFAFMQMNNFFGDGFYAFNGFIALVFAILAIITPVIYNILWFRWTPQQLKEKLWFLTIRVKRGEKAATVHEINEEEKSQVAIKEEKRSVSEGSVRSATEEST